MSVNRLEDQVIRAAAEMARFTHGLCVDGCNPRLKWSCCHEMYCREAITYARDVWGIGLQTTGHDSLPLLGPNGCIAAPHLRPICTVHLCEKLIYQSPTICEEYLALREEFDVALYLLTDC